MGLSITRGDEVEATVTFTRGTPGSTPLAPTFTVQAPDGTETAHVYGVSPAVSLTGTDTFTLRFVPTRIGVWGIRAASTVTVTAAAEDVVSVSSHFSGGAT